MSQAIRDVWGTERERTEVLYWLSSPDFDTVMDLADLPAREIKEQLTALFALPRGLAIKYGTTLRNRIFEGE